jgi:hypothetical protein
MEFFKFSIVFIPSACFAVLAFLFLLQEPKNTYENE